MLNAPSGVIATIASNMFERTGYTFRSWNTQPDESGETYMPGDSLTLTGDVTLYAQWESAPVNLVYDINNPYHRDYTGVINTTESEAVPPGLYSVKSLGSIFPEYTGECEFMWWNTTPDGTGTTYLPDSVLTVEDDVTLHAIWKSCKPSVSQIYEYDITVSGSGVVGAGDIGSTIWVTLPDGSIVSTTVLSNGTWTVTVPHANLAHMTAGIQVRVTQVEPGIGKLASDWVVTTILS